VTVLGHTNWPSRIAVSASSLYARNLFNFFKLMADKDSGGLTVNMDDQIIADTCLTQGGKVVHPKLTERAGEGA
jgi:NAD(P) transhydrogenase subunit alpha